MYILEAVQHETIWGGDKLKNLMAESQGKIGHLYMVNGHDELSNTILNGSQKGKTLKQFFEAEKEALGLGEFEEFPLTIALVDASENLSIQVHPNDKVAKELEGKKIGKSESWFFLEAPVEGWIYNGCCCATSVEVKTAVNKGKMEQITDKLHVSDGEYIYVEAGTLHALTSGSLVYEIEYGSDYTYRFYDYERVDAEGKSRELHIAKAIKAIQPDIKSQKKKYINDEWIREEYYETCRKQNISSYRNEGKEIECFSVLKGSGNCDGVNIKSGMSILLMPGEKLDGLQIEFAMIARVRR